MPARKRMPSPGDPAPGVAAPVERRAAAERGSVLILVAASIVVLVAFAIIAIDGPMLMTTKGQLQKAADSAALAGASGLLEGSQDAARTRAIEFAGYNEAIQDTMRSVVISPDDVTFRRSAGLVGLTPDIIRVQTHRTDATGDALRTYFRRLIDPANTNRADVTAVAEAQAYTVCGSKCLKPWCIPDRWDDLNGNGVYDTGEVYEPGITSYMAPRDVGRSLVLKPGSSQQAIAPGQYFPVCYPPIGSPFGSPETGGDTYREWIATCEPYTVVPGDRLRTETGNMSGPTRQGVQDLIAQDPGAHWDTATGTVQGSAFGLSPRVVLVPLFDPTQPPTSGRDEVLVTRVTAMFIEQISNGDVIARFMKVTTEGAPCRPGDPGAPGAFTKGITLIQ